MTATYKVITWHINSDGHKRIDVVDVQAEPVIIPGFEDYTFFVHKSVDKDYECTVTESDSGCAIARGPDAKTVVDMAIAKVQKVGKAKFILAIDRMLSQMEQDEPIHF